MSQHLYSLTTVFVLGLVFGIGPCTVTRLPFLGSVFLSKQGGLGQFWKIILPFSLGRLSSYAALGALSCIAGAPMAAKTAAVHTVNGPCCKTIRCCPAACFSWASAGLF